MKPPKARWVDQSSVEVRCFELMANLTELGSVRHKIGFGYWRAESYLVYPGMEKVEYHKTRAEAKRAVRRMVREWFKGLESK